MNFIMSCAKFGHPWSDEDAPSALFLQRCKKINAVDDAVGVGIEGIVHVSRTGRMRFNFEAMVDLRS